MLPDEDRIEIHIYLASDGNEIPEGVFVQDYSEFGIDRVFRSTHWVMSVNWLTEELLKDGSRTIESYIVLTVSDTGIMWVRGDLWLKAIGRAK